MQTNNHDTLLQPWGSMQNLKVWGEKITLKTLTHFYLYDRNYFLY